MQATEAGGREPHMDLSIRENGTREMQDVLSRYLPRFYGSAYRQLGNAADAEDAVQDALLAAFKHLDQFKGQAQMSTWLTTIVTNCARMQLRKRRRQPHVSLDEPSGEDQDYCLSDRLAHSGPSPEDECRNLELRRRLLESVAELSPPLRRAFELRDLDGRSVREAAHTLGLAEGTVKAQLWRAREKLTRLMRRALRPKPHSALVRTSLPSLAKRRRSERIPRTSPKSALRDDQ
jgi:RNA polymerase sigma-70 factor, ECF subfamily